MTEPLMTKVEQHAYSQLFRLDLHWSAPDHPPIEIETDGGETLTATNVSSYKGLRVWVCDQKPGTKLEALLDREIAKTSTDRLVIFHDEMDQVWRWPVRQVKESATTTRLTSHRHRNGMPNPKFEARLDLIRLPTDTVLDPNTVLAKVRAAFDVEAQNETKRASRLMARMYSALEKCYPEDCPPAHRDHEISVTLARILFLMFGDDTDMWPTDLFRDLIYNDTATNGSDIGAVLSALFKHVDTPPDKAYQAPVKFGNFPYVNGGIFNTKITLPVVNKEFRDAILDACAVDWSTISPAIFGSMFQSVRDAKTRRELGEHYTSEENILKTLNPLFLDELRADFERAKSMKNEGLALRRLRDRLGEIRYMDPACGCGNFIIIAYRELRDLELQILERLQDIGAQDAMMFANAGLKVSLDHFHGIEIDEWPARIAETAMFLVDRQCDLRLTERLGWAPDRLPIHEQARIVVGNALTLDWSAICAPSSSVIVAGNPPFLGHISRTRQQTLDLQAVWGLTDIGRLDYCTGWYAKALHYFGSEDGRWAFVSTSSICQGEPVATMWHPILNARWEPLFAHQSFSWTSEATGKAVVHCVIVGFARVGTTNASKRLFSYIDSAPATVSESLVKNINPYLLPADTVLIRQRRKPLSALVTPAVFGNMPRDGGHLIVEDADRALVESDETARKFLRPFVGARELLSSAPRWCLWLVGATAEEIDESPVLQERVAAVRAFRLLSNAASTKAMAQTPHLFGQRSHSGQPFLAIPAVVSENRKYYPSQHFSGDVIASNKIFTVDDPDGFAFAVLSSTMFITWQKAIGGRLESRLNFANTITWNNFPLPPTSADLRMQVIRAGEDVLEARALNSDRSLAQQYDPTSMESNLRGAHDRLDSAVDAIFGATQNVNSVAQRQEILFRQFELLTGGAG